MALEIPLRLIAVLLPPLLIFVCLTTHPGLPTELALWLGWLALALAMDGLTPRVTASAGPDGGAALLLCLLAIILQAAMLAAALWLAAAAPVDPSRPAAGAPILCLSPGTIRIIAAHELCHP